LYPAAVIGTLFIAALSAPVVDRGRKHRSARVDPNRCAPIVKRGR